MNKEIITLKNKQVYEIHCCIVGDRGSGLQWQDMGRIEYSYLQVNDPYNEPFGKFNTKKEVINYLENRKNNG